jgi:hypothetical protein
MELSSLFTSVGDRGKQVDCIKVAKIKLKSTMEGIINFV